MSRFINRARVVVGHGGFEACHPIALRSPAAKKFVQDEYQGAVPTTFRSAGH